MNRRKKILVSALSAALSVMMCATPVFAADIDLSRNGSIDVAVHAYASEDSVSGGTLALYRIADVYFSDSEGYGYVYTSEFAGCEESLLTEEGLGLADTADIFAAQIVKAEIPAIASSTVNAEGKAYFADLPCGLYMITQGTAAEGYYAVNPFLVTIPLLENGTWSYHVDATPKTSPAEKVEEPTTKETPMETPMAEGNPTTKTPDLTGSGTNPASRAKTGDLANVVGLVLIVVAAGIVLVIAVRRRRKI